MKSHTEVIKTRHHEYSLIFPIIALFVLLQWSNAQNLMAILGINFIALVGILASAFSV